MSLIQNQVVVALVLTATAFQVVSSAEAGDLKAPFELESAKVLPPGVRNPRFKNVFMSVDSRFDGAGGLQPLGYKLNKSVTWNDVREGQSLLEDRDKLDGILKDPTNGIELNRGPGETTGQVNTFADVKVPVFAMGVTERLTLAVAVPVMKIEVQADTGFQVNQNGQKFVDAICVNDVVKCNDAARKLNDAITQKLQRLNYEPIQSQTVSGMGDIKAVGKYVLARNARNLLTVKGEVTFPTGIAPNPDKALDVPTGDGQWDVGAGVAYERRLASDWTAGVSGSYVRQLGDSIEKRLPTSSTDSLSADKEWLDRKLGDIVSVGSSLNYEVPKIGMTLGAGYNFQFVTRTTFSGTQPENEFRYRLLEDDSPIQALHSATLVAGFSTVEWYQSKKFVIPFQANLAYSHPFAGRNVTTNDVVMAELVLFF